jgi:hypothetical protein
MTEGEQEPATRDANPFAPVPLGRRYGSDTITIPTAAIREATSILDEYLSAQLADGTSAAGPEARRGAVKNVATGNVLAVIGEHGTGKTHLALHLRRHAERRGGDRTLAMYLVARDRTFRELYRDFAEDLYQVRDQVRNRVRAVYAEIVAQDLASSDLTARVADGLADGSLDPVEVVERFGLMESVFLRELRDRLGRVTENAEFAIALSLLLRPAFEPAVWEWFLEREPDPILRERGITTVVNTEQLALEAMGVFALLYGDTGHQIVLVIDELEQILLAADRPDDAAVGAFKRLLEVFTQANGFLLLAGLPESIESLRKDVRQRVGRPVRMSPFSGADLRRFILERQGHPGTEKSVAALAPFTEDTIDYIVSLLGGVPRSILRVCYELYRVATSLGTDVTPAMVREVVRTQFNLATTKNVRVEIQQTLDASGYEYLTGHLVGRPPTTADYFVVVGDQGARCAVLLNESVLNDEEAMTLGQRVTAIRAEVPVSEFLLVVMGFVPDTHRPALAEQFGNPPLVYDVNSFGDDFERAFKTAVDRLAESPQDGDDELALIRGRLERLTRQQTRVHGFIGQVSAHLDRLQASSDRQLLDIQRTLLDLRQQVATTSLATGVPARPDLPANVAGLFAEADTALYMVDGIDTMLRLALRPATDEVDQVWPGLPGGLRSTEVQRAVGIGSLLQRLVRAFRDAVGEWYRSVRPDEGGHWVLADDRRETLDALCDTFDEVYGYLPVHRLAQLTSLTGRVPDSEAGGEAGERPRSVPDAFDRLGLRVRDEVLQGITGGG